jgi:large subunit ribosomal protein L29
MKTGDLREMTAAEVQQQLSDKEEELANLRIQLATRQLENPLVIRRARRDVAQIQTVIREHEMGIRPLAGASLSTE